MRLSRLPRALAVVGLGSGLIGVAALGASAASLTPAGGGGGPRAGSVVASVGTGDGTATHLLYSLDGSTWSESVTAAPGQTVTARLFYDKTTGGAITDASLTSSIPAGFTYVAGSTKSVLAPGTDIATGAVGAETKSVAVADSVWSGANLTVAPNAGFYGNSNAATSGVLNQGVKRYLNLNDCGYMYSENTGLRYATFVNSTSLSPAGTNASNAAQTAVSCGDNTGNGYVISPAVSGVQAIDLLGNRYLNLNDCGYMYSQNTSLRYETAVNSTSLSPAGTNASNTAQTAVSCGDNTGNGYEIAPAVSGVQAIDLLDTSRGQGYIEYKFTSPVPTCSTAATAAESTTATLTGTGTGSPSSSASVSLAASTSGTALATADDSSATTLDTAVTITPLANDTLCDTATVSSVTTSAPSSGSVVVNPDNTVTYTPVSGFVGTDSFTYTVTDSLGNVSTSTVTVVVTDPSAGIPIVHPAAAGLAGVLMLGVWGLRRRKERA